MKKHVISVFLVAIFILTFCACGSAQQAANSPVDAVPMPGAVNTSLIYTVNPWYHGDQSVYTTAVTGTFAKKTPKGAVIFGGSSSSIGSCDPTINVEFCFAANVYESLIEYDRATGEHKGLLATDWHYDDNGDLHITLRPNVKFHTGGTMSADDVLFTFQRLARVRSNVRSGFEKIDFDKSHKVDDLNLVIVFTEPVGAFINYLASNFAGIMSKQFCEERGEDFAFLDADAGTGAYYIVETVTGISQTFQRFEDYWGAKPEIERVTYRLYRDPTSMFIDFENGDIDLCIGNSYDSVSRVINGDLESVQLITANQTRTNAVQIATIGTPLEDRRVRLALAHAVDANGVLMGVYESDLLGRIATSLIPYGMNYKVDAGTYEYNPDKARELLKEAGYDNSNPLRLTMVSSNTNFTRGLSEAVQGYMMAVGVDFELTIQEAQAAMAHQNSTDVPPPFMLQQTMTPLGSGDPDEFLNMRAAYGREPGTFSSSRGILDQRLSELIVEGGRTTDSAKRAAIYKEIQEIIYEECYFLSVVQPISANILRTYLKGTEFVNSNVPLWKTWTIDEN